MTIRDLSQLANGRFLKKTPAILLLVLATGCVVSYYHVHRNLDAPVNSDGTRFLAHATINHKPATLAIDTASSFEIAVFKPAAERLGLKFEDPPMNLGQENGKALVRFTWPYSVATFDVRDRVPVAVAAIPISADIDGFLGWPLLSENILQIDASRDLFKSLSKVPDEASTRTSLRLRRNSPCLCLEIPGTPGNDLIIIDTGSTHGVALSPKRWCEWTNAHPTRPGTLIQYYAPGSGLIIQEESWARQLSLGPLTLDNVPVMKDDTSVLGLLPQGCAATLGMAALRRLELIVDGTKGVAYVRPSRGPGRPYIYNRAGLVLSFTSHGEDNTNCVIAHVLEGTPAYEAGIRTGDILVKIGRSASTNLSEVPWDFATACPAGTQVHLTFLRGDAKFSTTVVLRDIFPSDKARRTQ